MKAIVGEPVDIDNSTEELILTGCIVSTEFLRDIYPSIHIEFFESSYVRTVMEWVLEYAKDNKLESPGSYIQEIFEVERRNTNVPEHQVIEALLKKISKQYSDKNFNAEAFRNKALEYFDERSLINLADDLKWAVKKKGVNDAHKILQRFSKVSGDIITGNWATSRTAFDNWWFFAHQEVFRFPGALGRFLPPLYLGRLVAFLAPTKRGKTWWLFFSSLCAAMSKRRTIVFSLEMDSKETHERFHKGISAREKDDKKVKKYQVPIFDCKHNQSGECESHLCPSPGEKLYDEDGKLPLFHENENWEACTACRGTENDDMYSPSTWFEVEKKRTMTRKEGMDINRMFDDHFGDDILHLVNWSIGSKTVADIEAYLDRLEYSLGWIPEVVVIDYADILKKNERLGEKRHQLSNIWEQLAGLAKRRNVLLFTASQGNRASINKPRLETGDLAEDISKAMILDLLIAINEDNTDPEKIMNDDVWNRQRLECLECRYAKILKFKQCMTLNNLTLGQICIDSEILK